MGILYFFDIVGTIAFALSGYIIAAKNGLDILGITLISYLTAFGGGLLRDMILDKSPYVFTDDYAIFIVFITIIGAFMLKLHENKHLTNNYYFIISDSIGLVIFAYTGAILAINSNLNIGGVLFLSLLTATGGSVIRDMVLNNIPFIFVSEFYGTIAVFVGLLTYILNYVHAMTNTSIFILLIMSFIIRLSAIRYKWKLPKLIS